MARPLRIQYPGAFYHVTSRGNERKDIYKTPSDRQRFLAYLESASESYGAKIHAYCLMSNHYHLLIETPLGNLSRIMGHINGAYTTYFNTKRKRSGHLFQGRYKSILVEVDAYATELSAYIHLNPLRAGIVSRPEEFFWSSYRAYIGEIVPPHWLKTDLVLNLFTPNKLTAHTLYRKFVEERLGQEAQNHLAVTVGATFLGSDAFIRDVAEKHFSREQQESNPSPVLIGSWNPSIDRIVAAVDSAFAGDAKEVRKAAIYLCHKLSGTTLREIGRYFGLGESGVSQACRRYEATLEQDRHLKRKLVSLKEELQAERSERAEGRGQRGGPELLEKKITEVLKGFPQVVFTTLFGSAAKGRMTEQSDVDIAVAAQEKLSAESRGQLAVALSCALEREVDLIDLQAVSGLILEQALGTGKIVKNADHDLYSRLLKRLWYNQADMMPYYRRILEQRSRRWLQQ